MSIKEEDGDASKSSHRYLSWSLSAAEAILGSARYHIFDSFSPRLYWLGNLICGESTPWSPQKTRAWQSVRQIILSLTFRRFTLHGCRQFPGFSEDNHDFLRC